MEIGKGQMKIFYTANHQLHSPEFEVFNGEQVPHSEIPSRVENILATLREEEYELTPVESVTNEQELLNILTTIHDPNYISWLQSTHPTEAIYPSVFNFLNQQLLHGHLSIQWGNFCTDMFTPLLPNTWTVALTTAQTMYAAGQEILNGQPNVTVIGRPPGHHAGRSRIGGYCYLNNAAIAAQLLSEKGTVAILDVDYHHGNGTQDIFYDRADVLTCSIHADPRRKFPYFAGLENETGVRAGKKSNKNFPLAAEITNEQYQPVLEEAIHWISSHKPNFLIISLGLDTHESDPIADFKLTTEYYQKMARTLQQLNLPTLVVLEGGYSTEAIGRNMVSFLKGFS
jgi:acetoin utilization deacetylase AcuC-like enzyme